EGSTVTAQAPTKPPTSPAQAAGNSEGQCMSTRRLNCRAAKAVPQTEALLLVPNRVAGAVVGNTANSAGTRMRPPPPTIASTNPASNEASDTSNNSIARLSQGARSGPAGARRHK